MLRLSDGIIHAVLWVVGVWLTVSLLYSLINFSSEMSDSWVILVSVLTAWTALVTGVNFAAWIVWLDEE